MRNILHKILHYFLKKIIFSHKIPHFSNIFIIYKIVNNYNRDMKTKTIILSEQNSSGRGILTLYVEDGLLKAKLRLYQVEKLNQYCKLAVYHKQQVFSANLIFKNGVYLSSLVGDWDMDDDFYTAIVDAANNNNIIISGGSYAGYFFEDNGVFGDVKKGEDDVEKDDECGEDCDKCANCKYKEYFYSNHSEEQKLQAVEDKADQPILDKKQSAAEDEMDCNLKLDNANETEMNVDANEITR